MRRWTSGEAIRVVYHPDYRLPLPSVRAQTGMDPRRADWALDYVLDAGIIGRRAVVTPRRVRYAELGRVHAADYLESLSEPQTLANVLAVDESELPIDETLGSLRLACGGTLMAARVALSTGRPAANLLGGFHHAGPARGGGFSVFNDVAVAVVSLRDHGYTEPVVVLDLDAHPPDGIASCLQHVSNVWIGSLSGAHWGDLGATDETLLPPSCGDDDYLRELSGLLGRMPPAGIVFVLAGGDVLRGDRLGSLALTLEGARQRDLAVAARLEGVPSVWLPAGGYHPDAWKLLAGTVAAVAFGSREPVPEGRVPVRSRFWKIAEDLQFESVEGSRTVTEEDLLLDLGRTSSPRSGRFLGYYTRAGIEYGLYRYGVLGYLRRLGFDDFQVQIGRDPMGDRMRLFGEDAQGTHQLIDCVLECRRLGDRDVLYVHWLTLQNPLGRFGSGRNRLPGQASPGLGLAREAGEILAQVARRLNLQGFAFTPAWYHTAAAAREAMRFMDPALQGRFESLTEALEGFPLSEATRAVAEGRVRLNGRPYRWEAGVMVHWFEGAADDEQAVSRGREQARFTVVPDAS